MAGKRQDYINWDALFISLAAETAWRSKDPRTQNGACLVSPDYKKVAIGYNGFPKLKNLDNDEIFPWIGEGEGAMEVRYNFAIHAERNVLDNATFDTEGSILYLFSERGYFPCETCAQGIVQKGVSEIVLGFVSEGNSFGGSRRYGNLGKEATELMFSAANVKVRVLGPQLAVYFRDMARRFNQVVDMLTTVSPP
jgi:dCMP deaminase